MNKARMIVISLLSLSPLLIFSCASHTQKILTAEAHQSAALNKVALLSKKKNSDIAKKDQLTNAKFGEIANLAQDIKILLAVPDVTPEHKFAVADQLLTATLNLSGAPTEREDELKGEVDNLLENQTKNEQTIATLSSKISDLNSAVQKQDTKISKDNEEIEKGHAEVAKTSTILYQVATLNSSLLDGDSKIKSYCIAAICMVVAFILLRIFLTCTQMGATIAAKLP